MEETQENREIGMALVAGSFILALFLFLPFAWHQLAESPAPVAAVTLATEMKPFPPVTIEGQAAIVYDLVSGETLYAENPDAQLPLASLTKLLSVYAALSQLSPTTLITIPSSVTQLDLPRAFNEGQTLTLADISRLTLTASLNDGAAAILEAVASQNNQSPGQVLAAAASTLNLSQTYAVNGSGLDVSSSLSGGYGSARDLARLAGALVARAPAIAAATTMPVARAVSQGGTKFSVKNTDPIVERIPHLLLSKTGYTDLAGGNLTLVFDVGIGHPVAVVVMGSSREGRFADGEVLVAATFAHFANLSSL